MQTFTSQAASPATGSCPRGATFDVICSLSSYEEELMLATDAQSVHNFSRKLGLLGQRLVPLLTCLRLVVSFWKNFLLQSCPSVLEAKLVKLRSKQIWYERLVSVWLANVFCTPDWKL